jgi:transcriptional regulator with XRE-family HTH domain
MENINWGLRVLRLREDRGISKSELAKRSNLSASAITKIESGKSQKPLDQTVTKLAHGFRMSESSFRGAMFGETPPISQESAEELVKRALGVMAKAVSIYRNYPPSPGEAALTKVHVKREGLSDNVKGYLVKDDTLLPQFHQGEFIIVDHDMQPQNNNLVLFVVNDAVTVGKVKLFASQVFIETVKGNLKYEDVFACAVIVGSYRDLLT